MRFSQHPEIKKFVKDKLGCTCPDNVFDEIHIERKNQLAGKQVSYDRLLVGNRLLIYVLKDIDTRNLQSVLPLAVRAGIRERDTMKYNRLRLVLKCEFDCGDMERLVQPVFDSIPEKDEKIHLHYISDYDANSWYQVNNCKTRSNTKLL